jgi:hypothetical protein
MVQVQFVALNLALMELESHQMGTPALLRKQILLLSVLSQVAHQVTVHPGASILAVPPQLVRPTVLSQVHLHPRHQATHQVDLQVNLRVAHPVAHPVEALVNLRVMFPAEAPVNHPVKALVSHQVILPAVLLVNLLLEAFTPAKHLVMLRP